MGGVTSLQLAAVTIITSGNERCIKKGQSIAKFPCLHAFDTGARRAGGGLTLESRDAAALRGRGLLLIANFASAALHLRSVPLS